MLAEAAGADVVVMAAAVADFRPETAAATKLKKGRPPSRAPVPLVRNPDVLAELVTKRAPGSAGRRLRRRDRRRRRRRARPTRRAKLARKGCDLLVVNDVSGGQVFGRAENAVVVLAADGAATEVPPGSKDAVAAGIWDDGRVPAGPGGAH